MHPHRRPLLLLDSDPAFRAAVLQAAGRECELRPLASWEALAEALCASPLGTVVLANPCCASGRLAVQLRDLLRKFTWTTLVAVVDSRVGPADLRTLGEWGVADVVSRHEQAAGIRRILHDVRGRPLQFMVSGCLLPGTDDRIRSIMAAAVDVASLGGQGRELARALHVSTRTLLRWCSQGGLPPPRNLLAWVRILFAARMLDDPRRSVESVALACGYASGAGLGRALREFLGLSTRALRDGGALATAVAAFRLVLYQHRACASRASPTAPAERTDTEARR
ncbi:MAG TPA: helix-turn-helix domain-containing protein [Longimicrobium sp.]|jgi:AraC-like DNA-binding protein